MVVTEEVEVNNPKIPRMSNPELERQIVIAQNVGDDEYLDALLDEQAERDFEVDLARHGWYDERY